MSDRPYCFVLMPFGEKPAEGGGVVHFDAVYDEIIGPAVDDAGLAPIRADEEHAGGIIHKPMFERLVLCEYAVADLTLANANVFYELGVRHAARPHATVPVFAEGTRLPFDVALLRALPYALDGQGRPARAAETREALAELLRRAREDRGEDSPLYQLLEDYPDVQREKTDVFRDRVRIAEDVKERLARARAEGRDGSDEEGRAAVQAVEEGLGDLADQETGVLIDLLLSYRAVRAWQEMIRLAEALPAPVRETVLVQEQHAFALNRDGRGREAERLLQRLLERKGPSSETLGLLGRVYKDRWEAALEAGSALEASAVLDQAIDAYRRGFESDWRDAYPGINAVTLMEVRDPPDPRREALLPVVRYAAERRVASGEPDYWDHATLLEVAVLARDRDGARQALGRALAAVRERWEPETTARNLRLIREAREARDDHPAWAGEVEEALRSKAGAGEESP